MANIDNIMVVEKFGYFDVCVEYERLPVESFSSRQDAYDFINGYLFGKKYNNPSERGKIYRELVELEIEEGYELKSVNMLMSVC